MATLMAAVMVVASGCDKDAKPTEPTNTTTAAPDPAKMTDEQLDEAEIPTEEDFEDEAAQQITADTLDDELAKIEAEIDGAK